MRRRSFLRLVCAAPLAAVAVDALPSRPHLLLSPCLEEFDIASVAVPFTTSGWSAPAVVKTGDLVTASVWNEALRNNDALLRESIFKAEDAAVMATQR